MPSNQCSICNSPHRAEAEFKLARNVPLKTIAKQLGGLSVTGLYHHRKKHMAPALLARLKTRTLVPAEQLESQRIEESSGLLGRLVWQRAKLYALLETRESCEDARACVLIHKVLLENLALTGKLLGEFVQHSSMVTANLVVTPDYLRLRSGLLQALQRYPEARAAVLAVLRDVDGAAAFNGGVGSAQDAVRVRNGDGDSAGDASGPVGGAPGTGDRAKTHSYRPDGPRAPNRSLSLFPNDEDGQ